MSKDHSVIELNAAGDGAATALTAPTEHEVQPPKTNKQEQAALLGVIYLGYVIVDSYNITEAYRYLSGSENSPKSVFYTGIAAACIIDFFLLLTIRNHMQKEQAKSEQSLSVTTPLVEEQESGGHHHEHGEYALDHLLFVFLPTAALGFGATFMMLGDEGVSLGWAIGVGIVAAMAFGKGNLKVHCLPMNETRKRGQGSFFKGCCASITESMNMAKVTAIKLSLFFGHFLEGFYELKELFIALGLFVKFADLSEASMGKQIANGVLIFFSTAIMVVEGNTEAQKYDGLRTSDLKCTSYTEAVMVFFQGFSSILHSLATVLGGAEITDQILKACGTSWHPGVVFALNSVLFGIASVIGFFSLTHEATREAAREIQVKSSGCRSCLV